MKKSTPPPSAVNEPLWFVGIVEDNSDPTASGRVRVRCFGIHPPADSQDVLTEDLPWAVPINGAYGASSQIPKVSDWVFGFFFDGRDAQHPMLLGTIPGQNMQQFTGSGNSDPYTKPSKEAAEEYGKPPLHPAQTGENAENTQLLLQNAVAQGEPGVPHGSEPQKNVVWKSRYGNSYLQIDGTEDSEFMLLSHESGSHIMIGPNGDIKIKSFSDLYMSSEGNTYDKGNGSRSINIDGTYTIKSKNATIEVAGNLNHTVKGDYNLNVAGKIGIVAGNSFEVAAQRIAAEATSEHVNITSAQKMKLKSGSKTSIQSGTDMFITSGAEMHSQSVGNMFLASDASIHQDAGESVYSSGAETVNITGGSLFAADAGDIHLNSGRSTAATPATPTPEVPASPQLDPPVEQTFSDDGNGEIGSASGGGATGGGAGDLDDIEG